MTNQNEYNDYIVDSSFEIGYDVGRKGIGNVVQEFDQGQIISAMPAYGQLLYTAVYFHDEVYYATNIYLDPTKFSLALPPSALSTVDVERLLITGFALLFAFIFTDEKEG